MLSQQPNNQLIKNRRSLSLLTDLNNNNQKRPSLNNNQKRTSINTINTNIFINQTQPHSNNDHYTIKNNHNYQNQHLVNHTKTQNTLYHQNHQHQHIMLANEDNKIDIINNPTTTNKPSTKPTTRLIRSSTLDEEYLQKIKKQLIQPYKIIKQHQKTKLLTLKPQQLLLIKRGMSNCLLEIQKQIKLFQQQFKDNSKSHEQSIIQQHQQQKENRMFNQSSKLKSFIDQNQYQSNNRNNVLNSFSLGINNNNQNQQSFVIQYTNKIKQLQEQIDRQRYQHSQEIRDMHQSHNMEIVNVEEQHRNKTMVIKKDFQSQIDALLQAHKKREQQLKLEYSKRMNEQIRIKTQSLKSQQLIIKQEALQQSQSICTQYQNKQTAYKNIIKTLLNKLTQFKEYQQNLMKQFQQTIKSLKQTFDRLIKSQSYNDQLLDKNQQFLETVFKRISNILNISVSGLSIINTAQNIQQQQQHHKQQQYQYDKLAMINNQLSKNKTAQMPYCTMVIQNMFMSSQNNQIDLHNGFQNQIEKIIEKLVWHGFFTKENQQNIMSLISISGGLSNFDRQNEENNQGEYLKQVLTHTLYPLIMENIKVTLNRPINDLKDSYNSLQSRKQRKDACFTYDKQKYLTSNKIRQFDGCMQSQPQKQVKYRNIQSIEQLQVSDSMICDQSNSQIEQNHNNNIQEQNNRYQSNPKREGVSSGSGRQKIWKKDFMQKRDQRSPLRIDYNGYESNQQAQEYNQNEQQHSRSFDIEGCL